MFIVVELPMYDFVTVILGTLLVQLFLILFGVHFYFALHRWTHTYLEYFKHSLNEPISNRWNGVIAGDCLLFPGMAG